MHRLTLELIAQALEKGCDAYFASLKAATPRMRACKEATMYSTALATGEEIARTFIVANRAAREVGSAGSSTVEVDPPCNQVVTDYEMARLKRIEENEAFLAKLGLQN